MNRMFNIGVLLTANATPMRAGMAAAARDVKAFDRAMDQSAKNTASRSAMMRKSAAAIGVVIALTFAGAISQAIKFETAMRNVNSLLHLSEGQYAALGQQVLDMSKKYPQAATTAAEALYDIVSSGFDGAEATAILEQSLIAASAGMTDAATSSRAITASLNAYGLEAEAAGQVSDVLFETVNLGVISFEELAQTMGDFVGMSAQAGVGIADASAALATMTLSGISASEAGTSLNRLMGKMIDPSAELAATFRSWGYESGHAALQAEGLDGVMQRLGETTNGNVTQLMALFPEIRAFRGAAALLAGDGDKYAEIQARIADVNVRAGAAQKALNEQMKGFGYQLEVARGQVSAWFIESGLKALPALKDMLGTVKDLGAEVGSRFAPQWDSLAGITGNLWDLFIGLAGAIAPLSGALAGLVGLGVIQAFGALLNIVEGITGFLADNQELVLGLGAAYITTLVPAIWTATKAWSAWGLVSIITGLESAAAGATRFGRALMATTAAHPLLLAITVAVAALSMAFKAGNDQIERNVDLLRTQATVGGAARKSMTEIYEGAVTMGTGATKAASDLNSVVAAAGGLGTAASLLGRVNWAWVTNLGDAGIAGEQLKGVIDGIKDTSPGAVRELLNLGLANKQLKENADGSFSSIEAGRDTLVLTAADALKLKAAEEALAEETRQVEKDMLRMGDAVGLTQQQIDTIAPEDLEAMFAAMEDTLKGTTQAFEGASDAIGEFELKSQADFAADIDTAAEALATAEERLADARRAAAEGKTTADEERAIADAREAVTDATRDLDDAQSAVRTSGQQLRAFYREQIQEGTNFVDSVRKAAARGLDANYIQKLLEAGPEAAAPVLEAMLADSSGRLIEMTNRAEGQLRKLNNEAVEMARLTQIAINSSTDTVSRNVGTAMDIAATRTRKGARSTAEGIAEELGIGVERVKKVAEQYGIELADSANQVLGPLDKPLIQYGRRMNTGGQVPGGYGSYDDVPAMLTRGEFVHNTGAVLHYGVAAMDAVNNKRAQIIYRNAGGPVGTDAIQPPPTFTPYSGAVGEPPRATTSDLYDKVTAWIKANSAPPIGAGGGWKAQWEAVSSRFPDVALHSGFRPGSITATGNLSYHARGRAIDITPRMDIFNWLADNYAATELIYSPAGNRQEWHGKPHMYSGVTRDMHWDHIHWAMNRGGLVNPPRSFDTGGWLQPGLTLAHNGTGRPERVVATAGPGGAGGFTPQDVERIVDRVIAKARPVQQTFNAAEQNPMSLMAEASWALRR